MDGHVDITNTKDIVRQASTKQMLHPEEYGNTKLNSAINNGYTDLEQLDINIKSIGDKLNSLLSKTVDRLETVATTINAEKERLQDITMLCNAKTDYDNVIPLSDKDLTGNFSYIDGVFYSESLEAVSTAARVDNVTGNGYEGNKYVYQDKSYLDTLLDTKDRHNVIDNSISSYWEYSRITASNTEEYLIADFNTDTSESKCTVTLKFNEITNEIAIKSTLDKLKVTAIKYSKDNITYTDLNVLPFTLNNKEDSYKNQGYIYGSNIIAFPDSLYLKITFESIGYLDEKICFERVVAEDNTTNAITTYVPTAKRHVIRINDIETKRKRYAKTSVFKTDELITNKNDIYAISIFANIYLPNNLPEDYVKFTLTVNGSDYEVLPINSYSNGTKIIRFSQGKIPVEYTKYIGEKITSAYLTVTIKSKEKITPYINNLKVLLGGEV